MRKSSCRDTRGNRRDSLANRATLNQRPTFPRKKIHDCHHSKSASLVRSDTRSSNEVVANKLSGRFASSLSLRSLNGPAFGHCSAASTPTELPTASISQPISPLFHSSGRIRSGRAVCSVRRHALRGLRVRSSLVKSLDKVVQGQILFRMIVIHLYRAVNLRAFR